MKILIDETIEHLFFLAFKDKIVSSLGVGCLLSIEFPDHQQVQSYDRRKTREAGRQRRNCNDRLTRSEEGLSG